VFWGILRAGCFNEFCCGSALLFGEVAEWHMGISP
jgi:hypothetical protein